MTEQSAPASTETAFDHDSMLVVASELSGKSWEVGAVLSGVARRPRRGLAPRDMPGLLTQLERWKAEAQRAGRTVLRVVLRYEAGREGCWIARYLQAQGIEVQVMHPASIPVDRRGRGSSLPSDLIRGTDRIDLDMLPRTLLAWLRGEPRVWSMVRIPRVVEEDIHLADQSSGLDAVNEILGGREAPVVFITAYPERLLTGSRPEPTFLITKPFRSETMKAAISQGLFFDAKAHRDMSAATADRPAARGASCASDRGPFVRADHNQGKCCSARRRPATSVTLLHCCHDATADHTRLAARLAGETVMFSGAIMSLVVARPAAIVSFGGLLNTNAAATACHVCLITIGLFVVSAMVTILDLELSHDARALFARGVRGGPARRADPDMRRKQAM